MPKDFVQYGNRQIEYGIFRSKRKTVGISVSQDKGVRILAPGWVTKKQIKSIVHEKAPWIADKLDDLEKRQVRTALTNGSSMKYLGEEFFLYIHETDGSDRISGIMLDGSRLVINVPCNMDIEQNSDNIRNALKKWYKEQAAKIVNERVILYSGLMNVRPSRITVREQKTRWGSCSSKGNVNFNWKLAFMPVPIIDYVVVHELAHLKYMNHSSDFWNVVEEIFPDYKNRRKLLRSLGRDLIF